MRTDPAIAHGFAPAQLLLGRPLVYPFELSKKEIDFSGVKRTKSVVEKLTKIHNENFTLAVRRIKKSQKKYKRRYDSKNKVKKITLKVGDKVQRQLTTNINRMGAKMTAKWVPVGDYYEIAKLDKRKRVVTLLNPRSNYLFQRTYSISHIRKFRKKIKKKK